MDKFDAIIPAGGRLDESFAKVVGTPSKALIKFDDTTILEKTIQALRESGRIDRVVVVGSREVLNSRAVEKADEALPEGGSGPENIFRGVDALRQSGRVSPYVVVSTSDLPFLTGESVARFLDRCPENKDFCVPLIAEDDFLEAFPGASATFVKLRDGTWTTGCLYRIDAEAMSKALHHINSVFLNRKSKLGMARLLGARFVWQLLTRQLTVHSVEKKVEEILGCSGAAVAMGPPELAFDIDFLEDYQYALMAHRTVKRVTPANVEA